MNNPKSVKEIMITENIGIPNVLILWGWAMLWCGVLPTVVMGLTT